MPVAVAPPPATPAVVDADALVKRTLDKLDGLCTLPEVTAKIVRIVEDPKSSAKDLHAVVTHDPALVTRILKVVNSAFYGLPGQIASVDRAIVMLGLNATKNLAVAASMGQLFRGAKLCDGYVAKDLWTHCVAVAAISRALAKTLKTPLADEAFLAGMIHDLGLLAALQAWPEKLAGACAEAAAGVDFCAAERAACGVDHGKLGRALADKWRFPKTCGLVAGLHHEPGRAPAEHRQLVALAHVADVLACAAGPTAGFPLTCAGRAEPEAGALDALKLTAEQLAAARAAAPATIRDAAALMA